MSDPMSIGHILNPAPYTPPQAVEHYPSAPSPADSIASSIADDDTHCMICHTRYDTSGISDSGATTQPEPRIEFSGCSHSAGMHCIMKWNSESHTPSCPFCRQPKCALCMGELVNEPVRLGVGDHDGIEPLEFPHPWRNVEQLLCGDRFHHACLESWRGAGTQTTCPNLKCNEPIIYRECGHYITSRLQNHWATPSIRQRPLFERCASCFLEEDCRFELEFIHTTYPHHSVLWDAEERESVVRAAEASAFAYANDEMQDEQEVRRRMERRNHRFRARAAGQRVLESCQHRVSSLMTAFFEGDMGW